MGDRHLEAQHALLPAKSPSYTCTMCNIDQPSCSSTSICISTYQNHAANHHFFKTLLSFFFFLNYNSGQISNATSVSESAVESPAANVVLFCQGAWRAYCAVQWVVDTKHVPEFRRKDGGEHFEA